MTGATSGSMHKSVYGSGIATKGSTCHPLQWKKELLANEGLDSLAMIRLTWPRKNNFKLLERVWRLAFP